MCVVTKESNPELYNSLFENSTIEDAKNEIKVFKINTENITVGKIDVTKLPLDKLIRPIPKSIIKVGSKEIISFYKFNKFQKKMIKLFFGFEVEDYER